LKKVPRVEAEAVSSSVMDDEDISRFNFWQKNLFGQEISLEAKWTCNVIGPELVLVRLEDSRLVGN